MLLLLLTLGCGATHPDDDAGVCPYTLDDAPSAACPLHLCAATCRSTADGIACCLHAERASWAGDTADTATNTADTASPPRDPSMLSARAAICAAQVQGLPIAARCEADLLPSGAVPGLPSHWQIRSITPHTGYSVERRYHVDPYSGWLLVP